MFHFGFGSSFSGIERVESERFEDEMVYMVIGLEFVFAVGTVWDYRSNSVVEMNTNYVRNHNCCTWRVLDVGAAEAVEEDAIEYFGVGVDTHKHYSTCYYYRNA